MNMRVLTTVAVVAAFAATTSANAFTVTLAPMPSSLPMFDDVPLGTTGAFTSEGISFSGPGYTADTSIHDVQAIPANDVSNFLVIPNARTETLAFATPQTSFSLYWGSIDPSNTIKFNFQTVTGSDLVAFGATDNGDHFSATSNEFVTISGLSAFSSVKMSATGQCCFEFDMKASSIPEARTWIMMLLGFTGLAATATLRKCRQNSII